MELKKIKSNVTIQSFLRKSIILSDQEHAIIYFSKNSLEQIKSYGNAAFSGPKWPIWLEQEFFWKTLCKK